MSSVDPRPPALAAHGLVPDGRPALGLYLMLPSPEVAALVATLAGRGLDFVVIDAQHRPFNPETIALIAREAGHAGLPALVRVPAGDLAFAEMVLDFGVSGIVFPLVGSVEQAQAAAAVCRYPPAGTRSIGGIPSLALGPSGPDPLCVVQVERADAVPAATDILSVPGVDAVMPGPVDIAASTGMAADYGTIAAAVAATADVVREIERAADDAGAAWFRYCEGVAAAGRASADGCPLILLGNDADLLLASGRSLLDAAVEAVGPGGGGS